MRIIPAFILFFSIQYDLFCQDEIFYVNGGHEYVDQILKVENNLLYYSSSDLQYKVPLPLMYGYYSTIRTEKNLSKKFQKRKTIYHDTRSESQITASEFEASYFKTKFPEKIMDSAYSEGYYVSKRGDTTFCEIALSKNINDKSLFFIARKKNECFMKTAGEIMSYSVNEEAYRSISITQKDGHKTHQYALINAGGKLSLLHKYRTVFDSQEFSFLLKKGSQVAYPFDVSDNNSIFIHSEAGIMQVQGISHGVTNVSFEEKNLDNSFNELMPNLIMECPRVANKVKSEFYSKTDLMTILEEYNSCK